VYAEQAKIPDYVSALRKSFKPADTVAARVESVFSTHGAPLVTKIDLQLDPVADYATEKYGIAKEKCTDVIVYAQTKKDDVVSYAQEKKDGVINKAKETSKTVMAAKEDIVRQVTTGEIETTILKKAEFSPYTAWLAKTVITYKGKLVLNATTITTQIQTKSTEQMKAFMALAKQLKGKLPIVEVKEKVAGFTKIVTTKSEPYVALVTPYYSKAKTELISAKDKVYTIFMDLKKTYLVKKSA
jgi:hypothetical protein